MNEKNCNFVYNLMSSIDCQRTWQLDIEIVPTNEIYYDKYL